MRLRKQTSGLQLSLENYQAEHPGNDVHDALEYQLAQTENRAHNHITAVSNFDDAQQIIVNQTPNPELLKTTLALIGSKVSGSGENISLEEVQDYSSKAVNFILADAKAISEWLVKSLDHLDQRAEEYVTKAEEFEKRLSALSVTKTNGVFTYRSIVRNLTVDGKIQPAVLAVELDKFLVKIQSIFDYSAGNDFKTLLKHLQGFEMSQGNPDMLPDVFKASRAFYKAFLPSRQNKEIHDLAMREGRELWMDKTVYLGGKVFYAYTPTDLSETPGFLWSGFVRTTKADLDLKTEIPYLTKAQCVAVSKTLRRHAGGLIKAKQHRVVVEELLAIIERLRQKYTQAKRKKDVDARTYILLMNLVVSHLYGIQIKAINQAEGTYKAALKYIEKSLNELEDSQAVKPESKP